METAITSNCRVCLLSDSSTFMCTLVDNRTRELLFECTSVWVEPGDGYPQKICANCWNQCRKWSEFKSMAQASDRQHRLLKEAMVSQQMYDRICIQHISVKEEVVDEEVGENAREEEPEVEMSDGVIDIVKEEALEGYSLAPEQEESAGKDKLTTTTEGPSLYKRHTCEVCLKSFSSIYRLNVHRPVHSSARPFQCHKCDKTFKRKNDLKDHQLIHIVMKVFKCGQCKQKFLLRSQLIAHRQSHSKPQQSPSTDQKSEDQNVKSS